MSYTGPNVRSHSQRSAIIGSTVVACRAGIHDASVVTANAADGDRGYTVTNANPTDRANLFLDQRIDYVLAGVPKLGGVGHALDVRVFGDEPVTGMFGSDHYGVRADLRY